MSKDELENKRIEYQAAHDAYLHYDNYSWQVGSILIAGVFVYWGFLLSNSSNKDNFLVWGNILITLVLSIWHQYSVHNRQVYRYKLHRIHELEKELKMEQHLRFKKQNNKSAKYKTSKPSGHFLNTMIYIITSFGGLIIANRGLIRSIEWTNLYVIINVIIIIVTIIYGRIIETRTNKIVN